MQAENFYEALRELDRAGSFRDWVNAEYGESCYRLYEASQNDGEIYSYRINALYTNYAVLRSDLWDIIESSYGAIELPSEPSDIPTYAVNAALNCVASELYQEKLDTLRGLLDLADGLDLFHTEYERDVRLGKDLSEREKGLIVEYCETEPDTLQALLDCDTAMGLQVDALVKIITLENII